jgi:hypothetical protein
MQVHEQVQNEVSIGGVVFNSHDRPPPTFSSGRLCAQPECDTRLSIYNESEFCSLHKLDITQHMRGRPF